MTASKTPAPSLGRPSSPTPGGPYPSPQPSGPKPPPNPPPRSDIYAVAEVVGFGDLKTPARPGPLETGPCKRKAGGPVQTTRGTPGEEPTPGSAVVISSTTRESTGAVAGAGAAFLSGNGRAGDPPVPGAVSESFSLPSPPRFSVGTGPRNDALPGWLR